SAWLSAWSSRTACPIGRPVGTSGATTASSCPTPPSRTGWRRRGKNAEPQAEAGYLDWALAGFSAYLPVDRLYGGPSCVLSAVDGPGQRRLLYEVLEHDPPTRTSAASSAASGRPSPREAGWCGASPPTAPRCTRNRSPWSSPACRTRSASSTS